MKKNVLTVLLVLVLIAIILFISKVLLDSVRQAVAQAPGPQRDSVVAVLPDGACAIDWSLCDRCDDTPGADLGDRIRIQKGALSYCCGPEAVAYGDEEHCFLGIGGSPHRPADAGVPAHTYN